MTEQRTISPAALHRALLEPNELVLVDVREIGPYSDAHILFANPLPLPRLELWVADLIPRHSVPIIVCDGGNSDTENSDLAQRAARRLNQLGYKDVAVLEGGTERWLAEGYELFAGMNVPSKAFGEFVEEHEHTPAIDANELKRMQDESEDFVLLDSRPWEEYSSLALPGGVCCPGGELAYRVHDMAPSPETTVVVNCAGRTRSIIGCQSLVNAAIPNKVVALKNGVMGWHLAGHEIAYGNTLVAPPPSTEGLEKAQEAARNVAKRFGVTTIDNATLDAWRAEREECSLYVLDVRTREEFEQCRLADATHAPGGQLVQNTDMFVAIRGARLVLVDTDQVRAVFTASWLIQMGQRNVHVFAGDWDAEKTISGPREKPVPGLQEVDAPTVSPEELKTLIAAGRTQLLDVSISNEYQGSHIEGALWVPRARMAAALEQVPASDTLVLTSSDGITATLSAPELADISEAQVKVLAGGNKGWTEAGFETIKGEGTKTSTVDDQWQIPYLANPETGKSAEDNMREYLSWEVELINQIERDGTTNFRYFPHES